MRETEIDKRRERERERSMKTCEQLKRLVMVGACRVNYLELSKLKLTKMRYLLESKKGLLRKVVNNSKIII